MNHTNTYPHFLQRFIKRALFVLVASVSVLLVASGSSVFAADPPAITGVVPGSAYNTGGDMLTITGSGFLNGATVTVGGYSAQNVVVQSDTVLTATTPAAFALGATKVRVTNTDAQYAEAPFTYLQAAPTITAVTPNVGPLAGGRNVSITGSGFMNTLRFKEVAAGDTHALAITYDGKIYSWGNNGAGQLGNGTNVSSAIPVAVDMTGVLAGKTIVAVAAGDSHSLALDDNGIVYSWGAGAGGRLGNGSTSNSYTPVAVTATGVLAGKKIIAIASGSASSLVLASDGTLYSWGNNGNGQLGDGSTTQRNAPVAVNTSGALAGKVMTAIAVGAFNMAAIDSNGVAYTWGYNASGQLGNNSTTQSYSPVAVYTAGVLAGKTLRSIAAGNSFMVALDSAGKAYSWGTGSLGQLGNNSTTQSNVPVAVYTSGALAGKTISKIATSSAAGHVIALDTEGNAYAWGQNTGGALGDGSSVSSRNAPVRVDNSGVLAGKVLKGIAVSGSHSHAIDSEGIGYAWGQNTNSQLGNGLSSNSISPVLTTLTIPIAFNVEFGGAQANVTGVTANSITVRTPAHSSGAVDVSLSADHVTTATSSAAYTYVPQPKVYNTSPNELYGTGGDIITITGENFRPGAQVKLGNGPYTTATYINSTTLQVTSIATSQTGFIEISVKNDDEQVGTSQTSLRYLRATPVVNSLTPRIGPTIGGQTVTLSGSGFSQNLVFTKIGMGASYSCGVADSKVYCWGYGGVGALGNGLGTSSAIPTLVDMTGVLAGKSIVSVSAGVSHAVALDSDGKVYAWGVNTNGQLGDGSTTQRNVPVAVDTSGVLAGKRIVAISAGGSHTLALDSDGKVYAWGSNQGRLGNGVVTQSTLPVAVDTTGVLSGKRIVAISAGNAHSMAIDSDGNAYGWGGNNYGELGNNSAVSAHVVPVAVTTSGVLAGKRLVAISAGGEYTLAIDTDGKAYSWGRNNSGQLGINSGVASSRIPVEVLATGGSALSGKKVVAIEAGILGSAIALDSDGQASAWGYNNNGQLGNNTTTQAIYPISIANFGALSGKTITKIAAGYYGTLAVGNDNALYAWGSGSNGQLGNGGIANSLIPVVSTTNVALPFTLTFDGTPTTTATVSSDSSATVVTPAHSAGLVPVALSSPYFASAVSQGQYEYIPGPTAASIAPNSASVAGGDSATISGTGFRADTTVLFNDTVATTTFIDSTTLQVTVPTGLGAGAVNIMVRNIDEQFARLGRAFTYTQASQPTLTSVNPASGPSIGGNTVTVNGAGMTAPVRFTQVATGGNHSCGLTSRGAVYCWGYGTNGRLGNGGIANSSTPVAVDVSGVMAGKTIVAIAAGRDFTLALDSDGKVYAWGLGSSGQLGNSSGAQSTVPVAVTTSGVLSGKTITKIAAGSYHALALDSEGKTYTWGLNSNGQLGNNSTTTSLVPIAVTSSGALNGKTITAISAGASHNTVLDSDGKVYSWGLNSTGQLGNGNTTQYGVPIAVVTTGVLSGKTITAISAGGNHTLALDSDGKVYAWGRNNVGQLGEGSGVTQSSPVAVDASGVLAGKTIAYIATGESISFAIDSQSGSYSWGDNSSGQLGDGTQTQRSVPNIMATNIAFSAINGGPFATTTVGVAYDGSAYGWGANTYGQLGNNSTTAASLPALVSKSSMSAESVVSTLLVDGNLAPITSALETSLTYIAPAHPAGKVSIVAQGAGFSDITLANAYEYIAPPSATSITPASGYVTGGDTVTITGSNFSSGSTVTIGGATATVISETATSITITTPVRNAGSYDVVVTDSLGQSSTLTGAFTYRETPPVVTSITPSRGPVKGGQTVTIQGQSFSKAQFITGTGADHSCAITSGSGKAYCWGYNNQGQLGNGTLTNSSVPVAVKTDGVLANKKLVAISLGTAHTVALDSDGQLYAWGQGLYGQLGNSQSVNSSVPVQVDMTGVLAGKKILNIAAANNYTIALADDGRVYSWGSNTYGALGDGTQDSKNYPVAVAPSSPMYGESISTISAGYYIASALTSSGQVYVWGTGIAGNGSASGLLLQPTATSQSGKAFVDTATGVAHMLAITADGELYAWGSNDQGQLGNGNSTAQTLPVKVNGALSGKAVTKIAATTLYSSSIALTADNELYTWGDGRYGQMGDGTTANSRTLPVKINDQGVLAGKVLTTISGGGTHIIAQDAGSVLYAWGTGSYGKLGNGTSPATQTTPVLVTTTTMLAGATGSIFTLNNAELTASNQLNDTTIQAVIPPGQAGLADLTVTNTDGQSYTLEDAYEYVSPPVLIGVSPSSGRISGGDVVVLTGSDFSQGTTVTVGGLSATVTNITPNAITIVTPVHSAGAVDVVVTDQLGQSATLTAAYTYQELPPVLTSITPHQGPVSGGQAVTITGNGFITGGKTNYKQVAGGRESSIALSEYGKVYAWGRNNVGQLGNGTTQDSMEPTPVDFSGALSNKAVTAISSTYNHTLALGSDGKVYAWGLNANGQLGDGTINNSSVPVAVKTDGVLAGKTVVGIAAGSTYSLAVDSEGKVYAWGSNGSGALGTGTLTSSNVPVAVNTDGVLAGKTIVGIAAGNNYGFSLALGSDGQVYAWGDNTYGQLGDGTTTRQLSPVSISSSGVLAGKQITQIAAGGSHSLALDSTGQVYAWGWNSSGQVGDNTVTQRNRPVSISSSGVLAGKQITQIAGGQSHSSALDSDGLVYTWGWNNYGQLGDATTQTRMRPVLVSGLGVSAKSLGGGFIHTLVVGTDGQVYGWGNNEQGRLGDGTQTQQTLPVKTTALNEAPPRVTIGGREATSVSLVNDTTLSVSTPAGVPGPADLEITNYDGQSSSLTGAYEYVAGPTIQSTSPSSGSIAGGDVIYVSGVNFTQNTTVSFGGIVAEASFINNTTLLVTVPASTDPGAINVVVRDEFGQTSTLDDGYIYKLPAPSITTISPTHIKMSGGAVITINGTGFVNKSSGGSWYDVSVDGQLATSVTYVSATQLQATVPAHLPGAVDVVIGGDYSDNVTASNAITFLPEAYEFTNEPRTLMATEPGEFTVQMLDANGDPVVSTEDVALSLGSSSDTGFFARTLGGSDGGWDYDSVIIPAGQSTATFYYRDSTSGVPTITVSDALTTSTSQQVTINSRYKMLVTGISNPTQVGTPSSVTVQAVDYTGAPQADYRGTIHFTSDDGAATLPADYTFTATDRGRKTFINGVTMGTTGTWDVAVTDTTDAVITGVQENIIVNAPASGTIAQLKFITPAQSFPLDQTSGVISIQTQDVNGVPIPVSSDTSMYVRTTSSTGQFSVDNGITWQGAPIQVIVPAGSSYRNLLYKDTTAGTYELKVSQQADTDFGWQVDTQSVTVGVGSPSKLGLAYTNGGSIGEWVPVDITLTDESNNLVTSLNDVAVQISASSGGEVSLTADGSGASTEVSTSIVTGQQSVTVWVHTTSEQEITITATDIRDVDAQDKYDSASGVIQFGEATPTSLVFSALPSQTSVRTPTAIQVSVRDQFGNIVSAPEAVDILVSSDSSDGSFALTTQGPWASEQTVTIAAGTTGVQLFFKHESVKDSVTIQASSVGLEASEGSVNVTAGAYAGKVRFSTNTKTEVTAGTMEQFTIELLDAYGNPTVATETVEIGFGSTHTTAATWDGVSAVNPTAPNTGYTVSIPAGEGSATAFYRDTESGTTTLKAYDQARWQRNCVEYMYENGPCAIWTSWSNTSMVTQQVVVNPQAPGIVVYTSEPQVITKNTASAPITVELQDQYGNAAHFEQPTVLSLTTPSQYGSFALSQSGPFTATELPFSAGQSSATFYYQSSQSSSPEGDVMVVSGGSMVAGLQNIRVIEGVASQAALDTNGQTTAVAGDIVPVTLRAQTNDGVEVVVLEDTTVTLSSDEGEFSLTETPFEPITSATLPAETSSRQLFYRSTVAGLTSLSARSSKLQPVETEMAITANTFYKLDYTKLPTDQLVQVTKSSESMVATAFDEYGNVAIPSGAQTTDVALTTNKSAGEFALENGSWNATRTTISAGASTTQPFYYRIGTIDDSTGGLTDSSVLGLQTITAQAQDVLPAITELRVVGGLANRIVVTSAPQSLRAGEVSSAITIQLQDTDGTPSVASANQIVNLSSLNLNDDGDFSAPYGNDVFSLTPNGDPITSLEIEAGQSTATFYVMPQTAESHRLRVSSAVYGHSGGYLRTVSATQNLSVVAGESSKLVFTSAEQSVYPNKVSGAIKVALTDAYGNPSVNETERTLTLQSSCGTGEFLTSPTSDPVSELVMASGQTDVALYYRDSTASAAPCVITVSSNGLEDASQNLVVREPVYALAITSDPQTVSAGQTSGPIVVETRDRFGNTVTLEDPLTILFEASGNNTITPTERTIPAGSSSTQFTFRYDDAVSSSTPIRVTARDVAGGVMMAEQDVTVVPGSVSAAVFSAPTFSATVGEYHELTVQAVNAYGKRTVATENLVFNLSTSAVSGAFYQKVAEEYEPVTSVQITSGASESSTFYYRQTQTTRTQAGGNSPAALTAVHAGITSAASQATINAKILSFSTGNFNAPASSYVPLRATIPSSLPEDLTVTLSTTDTSGQFYRSEDESSPTTTTVIPAGQTQSEQLYYRQTSQTPVGYPETLTAAPGASSLSVWSGSVTAAFYLSELSQLVFINPADTLEQNQTGTFTVEARDELGNVVPFTNSATGYCLYVGSTSGTATISGNQNAGCTDTAGKKAIYVAAYQTRATFSYKDTTAGASTITAASNAGAGGIRVSTGIAITNAVTTKLAFDQTAYSLVRGDEITVGLRMLSAYNFEANSIGSTTVTLSSTSQSGKFFDASTNTWVSSLQLTIPAGQAALTGIRYSDSTADASATIQASAANLSSAQATVTMGVGVVSGIVFKNPPTILEKAETGTYRLGFVDEFGNEAPTTNSFCLYLQSSADGVIADMPTGSLCSDVTLPGGKIAKAMYVSAGRMEISFSYQSSALGAATLSASTLPTGGGIAATQSVTIVNGEPTRVGIEPAASTLERGGVMNGRAVLYNAYNAEVPATEDSTVRLSSNFVDGEFATAGNGPWLESLDVVIPSGSSAATFLYQTGTDYLGDIVLTSTSTSQPSLEGSTADVTVIMGAVAQLVFATPELTTTATHPSDMMTIEARNRYGVEAVVDSDLLLYLRSSSNTGVFAATPTGSWGISNTKILAGQSSVNVYYRDETIGTHTLTVRDKLSPQEGEEYLVASQQHHIVAQVFSHFIVTNISSPTRAGVASSVVVFAVDSENYVVAGYDGTITFSSDDPTAILPAQSYTFRPEIDRGIHTFNNGIAFKTTGTKSVTVTDQNGKQGSQTNIEVLAGNAAPVRSISFFNSDVSVDKSRPTEVLTMQLHDQSGALTNAPAGGMPLRLTSNSSTGEFSTDLTNWSSQLTITVEEGLSFSTTPVYYRDSTGGTHTITASDWIASIDNTLITNATLDITVNDLTVAIDQKVYSVDYQGKMVQNPYIFSHNEQGDASGYTTLSGVARDIPTGNEVISNWNIQIAQVEDEVAGTSRLSYQSPTLARKAGDANLPLTVQVTSGSLISSWQGEVPISPWRATLDQVAIDDTVFTGRLTVLRNGQADDSPQAIIQLTGGVNQVTRTWHLSELLAGGLAQQLDRGVVNFRVPLRLFSGGDYSVFVQLSDGNGITAQDATQFSVTRPVDPAIPTVPGNTGGSGTISPETPGDTSSRPEPARPTPPRDGAYEQSQPGLLTRFLESPSTPIRVAQSMLGLLVGIALVLAYQMYREWRHARFLLAVIRRDNETLANKDAFLQLASHHLRTPLTLLSSSSELLNINPSEAVKQINQQLAGVIAGLKAKAEDILARTSTSEEVAIVATTPDEASARRNVYRSPVFWVPVILTIVLTIAVNWAVQTFGGQTIAASTIAGQVALLLLGGVVLYTVARLLVQRRQQSRALEQSRAKTRALNDVKVNFARQVGRDLTDDILHVNAYIQQLAPMTDATSQNLLKEGVERLERLVSRFTLLNTVYANTTQQDVVDMQKTVDEVLQLAQQQNPAVSVSIDGSVDPITTRHSRWMVSRLLQDVVTSMVPLAGNGIIRVNSKQTKDATTLTITGPSNHDAPAEDLFSVYSRADEELAGTFSTEDADNRMHRLDLYLDRMIADELQAELSAQRVGGQMQVTVELPNAA